MASPTQWTWVRATSGNWWWAGRPGVLQSIGSQRVRHDWATELNWREVVLLGNKPVFPGGLEVKNLPVNAGDVASIFGSGRSPGVGNGNSFQYSCLENPMDRGACWVTVHGVAKSCALLNTHTHQLSVRTGSWWEDLKKRRSIEEMGDNRCWNLKGGVKWFRMVGEEKGTESD